MTLAVARTCISSGLRLLPLGPTIGYHVGKATYPQPSAPERTPDRHRQDWGRFDTLGCTYYVAETPETAFAEVLAFFKLPNGALDPLADIADALGISRAQAIAYVVEDWEAIESDFRGVGAVPAEWRTSRRLYEVQLEDDGWVVDIQHPDSIAALEAAHEGRIARWLAQQGVPALTVSTLTSENRLVTTMLAELIREAVLDDGTSPPGVYFGSKHGGAWCRGIWIPESAPPAPRAVILSETLIAIDDPALLTTARRFRLDVG